MLAPHKTKRFLGGNEMSIKRRQVLAGSAAGAVSLASGLASPEQRPTATPSIVAGMTLKADALAATSTIHSADRAIHYATLHTSYFCRGDGGFGGDPGPAASSATPDRVPDGKCGSRCGQPEDRRATREHR